MNLNYLNILTPLPKQSGVVLANPGTNVKLTPNYFHYTNKSFRMGDDFLSLQSSSKWYQFHVAERKVIYPSIETHVGITEEELDKINSLAPPLEEVEIEVDLLRCNQNSQTPTEIFLPNGSEIEINGDIYKLIIQYSSGNFHMSNIPIGIIGERFKIKVSL